MKIKRFSKEKAQSGHNGTILTDEVIPEGMKPPFDSAWGYLENNSKMEVHSHPVEEIYIVIKGEGKVMVADEVEDVTVGDVVEIPPDKEHTMICENKGPFLWVAFWWEV